MSATIQRHCWKHALQVLHDFILLEGIVRMRGRLDVHAVVIEVEYGRLSLGKERFVVEEANPAPELPEIYTRSATRPLA